MCWKLYIRWGSDLAIQCPMCWWFLGDPQRSHVPAPPGGRSFAHNPTREDLQLMSPEDRLAISSYYMSCNGHVRHQPWAIWVCYEFDKMAAERGLPQSWSKDWAHTCPRYSSNTWESTAPCKQCLDSWQATINVKERAMRDRPRNETAERDLENEKMRIELDKLSYDQALRDAEREIQLATHPSFHSIDDEIARGEAGEEFYWTYTGDSPLLRRQPLG